MKTKLAKIITIIAAVVLGGAIFTACAGTPSNDRIFYPEQGNQYSYIDECPFFDTTEQTQSTIALSVNTASYTEVKNLINQNSNVDKNAVRIEEFINYFSYDYDVPTGGKPLAFNGAVIDTPWNDQTKLLIAGLKAENIQRGNGTNNIVFLIDVSGSMNGADRIDLIKSAMTKMVDQIGENDIISIITYANGTQTLLNGANGTQKSLIKQKINSLVASGATAGSNAIERAYTVANQHKAVSGQTSLILITDGDFNVGPSSTEELKDLILEKRNQGFFFSTIGVGMGNFRSELLEELAYRGGGMHHYIATEVDAARVFVDNIGGLVNIVAVDAKAQIEFNPSVVSAFRLVGYENRQLEQSEWEDDNAQAGTIGSGTETTAVYEIKLANEASSGKIASISLKYFKPDDQNQKEDTFDFSIESHLNPQSDQSGIIKSEDRLFIASVIEFGLLLRNSQYKGTASYSAIVQRIEQLSILADQDKAEFLELVKTKKSSIY